jgi:RNA recognition motif-containing protein
MNHRLHIGNLSPDTTAASISEAFQRDGRTVARVQLVMSRDPGRSRGFAFVDMLTSEEASAAVAALHGTDIGGRTVRVSIANEPKSRFGGIAGGRKTGATQGKP